jgi:macrolide-specific efflux system membrane fusion protein
VSVARVEARDVPVEVRAPVDLRPLVQADVGSKTLGYLDAVLVDRGDKVTRGQLLALVRPSDLPDQLAAARSTLAQAQSATALARTNFEARQAAGTRGGRVAAGAAAGPESVHQRRGGQQAAQAQIAAVAVRLARRASPRR